MRYIDMTHTIKNGMPCFGAAWHISPEIKKLGDVKEVGRNTSTFLLGSHTGTHMDAPLHFIPGGNSIESLPLDILCGAITVVDFRKRIRDYEITLSDVENLPLGERMLFVFGWDKKWETTEFYQGYPYFSVAAAKFLVDNGVKLIAMDSPSPDDSRTKLLSPEDSIIHKLFLGAGVILVEYLNNTSELDFTAKHELYALPLKVLGADGSPSRVVIKETEEG